MGFWTAVAATAAAAGGSLLGAKAAADNEAAQAKIEKRNAAIAENDAIATNYKTRFDQLRQLQHGKSITGGLRARLGASGAVVSEGAPELALASQAVELALENAIVGHEGRTQSARYRSQAAGHRYAAKLARTRGRAAWAGGAMDAGSAILQGGRGMYDAGMFGGGSGGPEMSVTRT